MSLRRIAAFHPFRRAMADIFETMERDMMRDPLVSGAFKAGLAFPSESGMDLDLKETSANFELSADLPGMRKEDITIDVDKETGILTVTGERKDERTEKSNGPEDSSKYHVMERSYGKTTRSVRLPGMVDTSKASAAYTDGVLKLTFPKLGKSANHLQIAIDDEKASIEGSAAAEKTEK